MSPRLTFPNYTKITKYEASEKNAVSETEMPHLGNLKDSRNSRKAPVYWEIFGLSTSGDLGALVSVAEGEELGSNLLHVGQRTLTNAFVVMASPVPTRSRSIILSTRANTMSGKVRPSAAAVLRFGQVRRQPAIRLAALPGPSLQYLIDVNSSFAPHLRQVRVVARQAAQGYRNASDNCDERAADKSAFAHRRTRPLRNASVTPNGCSQPSGI